MDAGADAVPYVMAVLGSFVVVLALYVLYLWKQRGFCFFIRKRAETIETPVAFSVNETLGVPEEFEEEMQQAIIDSLL